MVTRKKIRYKRISFKITSNQKEIIRTYCKSRKTTPIKLFKKAVKFYMEKNQAMPKQDYHISKNQLKLFDLD
ncbi:MAG: hypothetical protein AUJ97_01575 [Bacteroidetes bacterium CG2_30_32_10]|nr:MAG: hypothetical protein AUJ97_01575 [Bacteroidetes bacterium CG2_30_32_10]